MFLKCLVVVSNPTKVLYRFIEYLSSIVDTGYAHSISQQFREVAHSTPSPPYTHLCNTSWKI
jgi:predicted acyltransferase (DUF342 family)